MTPYRSGVLTFVVLGMSVLALAALFAVTRRRTTPPPAPDRLDPVEGPTKLIQRHPGHPSRFRGARKYWRTGTSQPAPYRRRSEPGSPRNSGNHRIPDGP